MKKLLLVVLLLGGCANMTEREKQTAWIVGAIVVGAVAVSASQSSGSSGGCTPSISVGPNGSDQVCR